MAQYPLDIYTSFVRTKKTGPKRSFSVQFMICKGKHEPFLHHSNSCDLASEEIIGNPHFCLFEDIVVKGGRNMFMPQKQLGLLRPILFGDNRADEAPKVVGFYRNLPL